MARLFTAANSDYLSLASAPLTAVPFTVAGWIRNPTTVINTCRPWSMMYNGNAGNDGFYLEKNGNNFRVGTTQSASAGFANSTSTPALGTANTWFHLAGVFASAADRRSFINGANKGTNATSKTPANTVNQMLIGAAGGSSIGSFYGGRQADWAMWNVALLDEEIAALAAGLSPLRVRSASLIGFWAIWGLHSPEIDLTSNARSLTLNGSPTIADGPPVLPRRRLVTVIYDPPAAGATGTGTPSLPALTGAGTGVAAHQGSGTPTLPPLTAAGTGVSSHRGSGTPTLPHLTAAGSGVAGTGKIGTGALTLPSLTANGTGRVPPRGSGSPSLPRLTASGTGTRTGTGASAPTGKRTATLSGLVRTATLSGLVRTIHDG